MKALCNQRDLYRAYNAGDVERVAVDLNRYFAIERDDSWTDNSGEYRRRSYLVKHSKGIARWHTVYHNGNLHGIGCIFEVDVDAPYRTA
ncbi:hypothetical protein QE320_gp079 [Pseudomonas phage EM]|uniref:DUF7449 domain-containing protein n=1 Tax=Pseudomonas phage EM TaxID=2936914 RepID=A0AAE9KU12_9CAUD|nr:hypothetical protein QE320_gp079 [Pseudomonas phage EM]UPW35975.1 hypothetical protein EM_190 [Pseudomonas phage EM]